MCRIKMKNDSGGPFRTLGGERKLEGLSFLYPGDSPVLDYRPPRNVRGCPGEFPELSALDLDVGRNVHSGFPSTILRLYINKLIVCSSSNNLFYNFSRVKWLNKTLISPFRERTVYVQY